MPDNFQNTTNIANTSLAENLLTLPEAPTSPLQFVTSSIQNKAKISDAQAEFRNSLNNQVFSPFSTPITQPKMQANTYDTPFNEVYAQLNDGTYISKFDNYITGTNNEDRLAQQQGTGEKWLNGGIKFLAKTGVNVLDATIGTVNGVIEGVGKGSFNAVYNNDFSSFVDDLNTKLDNNFANLYTTQEREASLGSNLFTSNFWADKVLAGMSFVTGTLISEALWATATGGASLATIGARGALKAGAREIGEVAIKNQNKIVHSITNIMDAYQMTVPVSKSLKAFNNARFLYTSAGYESGVEARHFTKEAEANFIAEHENKYGRRPSGEELGRFRSEVEDGANAVFATNLALVGGSNIAQFGTLFGAGSFLSTKGLQRGFNRTLGIGIERTVEEGADVYRALNPTRTQKILGTAINVLKSPIREGVIEEGGQSVIGNFGQRWLESKYDVNAIQDNFSTIDALGKSLAQTYGTKEGLEEVLIGFLIGGLSTVKSGFGLNEYKKDLAEQTQLAGLRTKNSDYNIIKKFSEAASQKASREKAVKSSLDGVVSNQELNIALFSKLQVDDMMGRLDTSSSNFSTALNELSPEELAQQLNVSPEEAQQKKDEAILAHTIAVKDYKEAQSVAESLIPEGEGLKVDGVDAYIPKADAQSMLALNIYMGRNSDRLARSYAKAVSETIGDTGTESALLLENTLQDKQVNKSREVKKLSKELQTLDFALNRRNEELIKIAAQPRSTEGDSKLQKFETRRQELLLAEERDSRRREEINAELSTIAEDINQVRKARKIANQDFDAIFDTNNITPDALLKATQDLEALSKTLDVWRNSGQESAAKDVEYLINQFSKAQTAYRFANETFNKLSNPILRKAEVKNIFGGFLKKAKKAGADISDYDRAQQDLFVTLRNQYLQFKAINNIFDTPTQTAEDTTQTVEGDNLPPIETKESAQISAEQEVIDNYKKRREELQTKQNKEKEVTYSTRDVDGEVSYYRQVGENTKEFISEEQFGLENYNPKDLQNSHSQELEQLNSEEQVELERIRAQYNLPQEPDTLKARLQNLVNKILEGRRDVEVISTPLKKPTEEQITEYKKLYERNRKSTNGLRPADLARLEELKDTLNTYGRAVGTVEGGVILADILEQIATLDEVITLQEQSPIVNNTNTEEIQAKLTVASGGRDTYDKTQYWEKSEFRVLENGTYSITGINLQGLVDTINTTNNAVVLRDKKDGKRNNRKAVTTPLTGENYTPTDKFILQFEQGVEVGVTIGNTRNLEITPAGIAILNERTRFKLIPSTNLGTNYQPLLIELNANADITPMEVMNSNFELEPGLAFTDFTNKADDTETSLQISTRNEYNKNLISQYREGKIKLQELTNNIAIYVMSEQGEVGGVLKALPNQIHEDSNYEQLAQIRNIATQRALESNLENNLIDTQISVPIDRNGSYFGKPNFNLILDKTTDVLSTELLPITEKALQKITDVGYITDGKLTLKGNEKTADKINTMFVKSLSRGRRLPIIIFNYNGSRVAYPVSMNSVQIDKVAQFIELLNSSVPINEKIKNLNEYLSQNSIDSNMPENGFYYMSGETNIDDPEHIARIQGILASQESYGDFTEWIDASSLEAAKILMQTQAAINIDITDKPFHSPKLALKLKDRTIIGSVNNPSITIVDKITPIKTKMPNIIDNSFVRFAEETTSEPTYKKIDFLGSQVTYVVTDQEDDFSGKGASFSSTWNVAKYNQGTFAHVRILMTEEQKNMQTKTNSKYDVNFHNQLKDLAKSVRTLENVVILDIRPSAVSQSITEQIEEIIKENTCG